MTGFEGDDNPNTYAVEGRYPSPGDHAKIVRLGSTMGMLIMQRHLAVRAVGVTGTVLDWVPGHGGDVWWVHHDESDDIGAYSVDEMAQISRIIREPQPEDA